MTSTELVPYTDAQYTIEEATETDSTLIDAWLHGVPAQTQRAYRREIRDMQYFLGDKQLQDITLLDLQQYDEVVLMRKAPASRKRAISATKSLYKRLRQSGLIQVNPAEFLRLPKIKETQAERYLTTAQVDAIVAQAKNQRDRAMLNLFYQTGMRVSEVVALTWKDILPTATGATLVVYGKGGKTRYVAIDELMRDELLSLPHTADCVFPSGWIQNEGDKPTGKPITTTQAQRIVVAAAEGAGIDASPHFFRHAHISHLFEAGVNAVEIRDEVGHASIATTNKYAHSVGGKALGSVLRRK
jgi:site-specific recombinase XerD